MVNPKSAYSVSTKKERTDTHIIVVWVDNEAGVLARVVGLFSGRGYNIESLAVAEVDAKRNISRITIVTTGTPQVIDQIKLQLKKLVPVHKVADFKRNDKSVIFKEMALFKIVGNTNKINALCILDNGRALDISKLSTLIKSSSFVIANDTGPAHMAAHLNAKGLTLFGSHASAFLQSIERENFKAIQVSDLNKLSAEKVFEKLFNQLS